MQKKLILKIVHTTFLTTWLIKKNPSKIRIYEKSHKNILIYYISYATTNNVKPLYCIINKIDGYIEVSNGNKYLTLVPPDQSKDIACMIASLISYDYDKEYMKVRFNLNDDLSLKKKCYNSC